MTGELSLTGRVLPIGGVREKLLAARRSGIETVILPLENKRDLHDLPIELLRSLEIHFVSRIEEVFPLVIKMKTVKKPTLRTPPKTKSRNQLTSLKQ
jgi:ATP-dependent Lon protease